MHLKKLLASESLWMLCRFIKLRMSGDFLHLTHDPTKRHTSNHHLAHF